jgi:hypothetical protein
MFLRCTALSGWIGVVPKPEYTRVHGWPLVEPGGFQQRQPHAGNARDEGGGVKSRFAWMGRRLSGKVPRVRCGKHGEKRQAEISHREFSAKTEDVRNNGA